ncbi:uncharacterized protein LOC116300596 [Actinia tenebrosa]|uniref:Uncharacterized protein LOC116300596 n=1 Tax=Actinia tenebrosa TaxID=6105 RepID=A0A6P8ICL6_ACTTE|nr:uncharacterized protein LOC116300596 [Actinia tenebrosa]
MIQRCSVGDSKGAKQKKMKFEREKLVPWLIQRVDSGEVPGLRWLDKERTKFRITWKHAGKPDFEQDKDAVLFRMWAEHTGKYKRGEQPDPSTWKTRFRCALRKMPDIEEIRVPHSLDEKEPYRVFRVKSKVSKSQSKPEPTSIFSVLDTPSPSPTNDAAEGSSSFSSLPAASNRYMEHSCIPAVDVFAFPSPNSSHTSSPTHASDISNGSSVFSDDEDNIDNITPTLPPLAAQQYQPNDFRMTNNGFGSSFSCTNPSLGYYPMANGSYSQSLLNFTEIQKSGGIGYGGGGSAAGMYQGIRYSGMESLAQSSDFTTSNNDGLNTSSQMGLFLKMLHAAATSMENDGLEYELAENTSPVENSMSHGFQQMGGQVKQPPVTPPSSYSEKMVVNDMCKIENPECHLFARVFYEQREVATFNLDKQKSAWRLFYGKQDPANEGHTVAEVYSHLYGTCDIEQIQLPDVRCSNDTHRVLANFNRGLALEMGNDGDIWATRKSMTKVFFSSESRQATKMVRDVKTKVFDFSEFQQTLQQSHKGTCAPPCCDVTFTLGWPNGLIVCIAITHAQAKQMLLNKMNCVQTIADLTNEQIVFDFAGQFMLNGTVLLDNSDPMSVKIS